MPCRGPEDDGAISQRALDEATRAACDLIAVLRKYVPKKQWESHLKPATREWIWAHDKLDQQREDEAQAERDLAALKRKAKAKLTPEERKALRI